MTTSILNFWPMPNSKPRASQEKVLQWVENLPPNIKYILCEVPVGGGKSPIGLNYSAYLAESMGSSFILTPQKILQKQYQDSFERARLFSIYGKSNYRCESKDTNCDIGSDIKPKCVKCPHRDAMDAVRSSPNVVMNYTLALLYFMLSETIGIKKRKLMILDECHTLEHHLTEFRALQIGEKRCRQFKVKFHYPRNEDDALDWIEETYLPAVESEYRLVKSVADEIMSKYENDETMSKSDAEIINKLKDIKEHITILGEYLGEDRSKLIDKFALIKDKTYFKFKPLYGKDMFNTYMKPMADRFLFMSSTILDKDAFCRDMGIPASETAFLSVDSEFELENRPVLYTPKSKMTYGWDGDDKKGDRRRMIDGIIEICKQHEGQSGIIHTASFQVANWLIEQLDGKIEQRIMHHNPEAESSRDEVIEKFTSNNNEIPSILISPSITEGLDLKHDRGRFSIIVKVPYPYLGDAWVKRRQELSKEWYMRQAMIGIIQGSGRVVRAKDDWGYTYILDESFAGLLKFMDRQTPKWFKDSIIK